MITSVAVTSPAGEIIWTTGGVFGGGVIVGVGVGIEVVVGGGVVVTGGDVSPPGISTRIRARISPRRTAPTMTLIIKVSSWNHLYRAASHSLTMVMRNLPNTHLSPQASLCRA